MNLTTSSGLVLSVKNLSFQVTDLFSGHAHCNGFDSISFYVGGVLFTFTYEQFNEAAPVALYVEINNALDAAAQTLADDELASALQDRHDYRVACHG